MKKPKIARESMKRLIDIKAQIADNRKRYDDIWKQAARYTNPSMADWNDEPGQKSGKKPDDTVHIYDNTVQKASQTLTDGIQGYSFARNQAWFKAALENKDELTGTEAEWLQGAERKMYAQLQKSNFYDEGRTFVMCCADFGTAIMIRTDDVNRGIPTYRTEHLKWCYIDENEYGEVDVLFRDFWISAYRAAALFGRDALPAAVRDAYDQGKLTLFKFTQAILPPERYDLDVPRKNRPFYSLFWFDNDRENPIMDGWFNLKPFFVWRWSRNLDGDVWGVDAPGILELPTVKQLNSERRSWSRMVQSTAEPVIKATEGLAGRLRITPHGVNYLRSGEDFTFLSPAGDLSPLLQDMALLQKSVNESYYTDFFLILSQNMEKQKTATEVAGIQGEKAALLSAFYGRLSAEFLEPVSEDLFAVELQAARIPVPPDTLAGSTPRIDMISPLAQMQKRYLMLGATQQAIAEIATIATNLNPAVLDNLNLDQYIRDIADAYGLDKRIVIDMADVERMRAARAQQQAAMLQQQAQMEQAKIGVQAMGKIPEEALGSTGGQV
jgi:hypothetical protein